MTAPVTDTSAPRDFDAFLSYLETRGLITGDGARRAGAARAFTDHPADTLLIELGLTREVELAGHMADFLGLASATLDGGTLDGALLERIGPAFCEAHHILPVGLDDGRLVVALADPFAPAPAETAGFRLDHPVLIRVAPRSQILEALAALGGGSGPNADARALPHAEEQDDLERLRDVAREAPVIRFVTRIIQEAVDRGATDIHLEPRSDHVCIRLRCDGMLGVAETVPRAMLAGISTRIKILARLNIAERRLPQDGRMRVAVRGQEIDLRVSVLPSVHGESFVLRVLDRSGVALSLGALGYGDDAIAQLGELSRAPNGIILVTGPTGSGKTTTLYSILRERQSETVKIFTVEDPVEYRLDGITQLQIDPAIDLGFAKALRSVLRHDPDLILVGEIRDRETAQIAIQAALTGHLVFSTLHTNSAAGALTRLVDMGVDGYLIGATIRAVVAQRLVRRICRACAGVGCDACRGSGFSGRTVTYEILPLTRAIAAGIVAGTTEAALEDAARRHGFTPMADHATALVARGITSPAEVDRVLDRTGGTGDARP